MRVDPVTVETANGLTRGDITRTTQYPDGDVYPEFKVRLSAASKDAVKAYLLARGIEMLTEPKAEGLI